MKNRPEVQRAYYRTERGKATIRQYQQSPLGRRALKRARLKKKFGLSLEDYELMVSAGDGRCWLCKRPSRNGYPLAVDHDHETKAVRGILCHQCNTGIGMFQDNPDLIIKAVGYLVAHRQLAEAHHG